MKGDLVVKIALRMAAVSADAGWWCASGVSRSCGGCNRSLTWQRITLLRAHCTRWRPLTSLLRSVHNQVMLQGLSMIGWHCVFSRSSGWCDLNVEHVWSSLSTVTVKWVSPLNRCQFCLFLSPHTTGRFKQWWCLSVCLSICMPVILWMI